MVKCFLMLPLKQKKCSLSKVYLNLIVLLHIDIVFLIHNIVYFVFVVKAILIICWWFDYEKRTIFDMYQHYRKPLKYASLKFKNNCHIYAFTETSVHKSKKMFLHR